jgi:hypothetical protein
MKIAGFVFEVKPLYETTALYCRNYLTELEPDYMITVSESDLISEQFYLDEEAREEGMKLRKFTPPFLERTAIQRKVAEALINHNTLLLHGSTVAVDGQAYLFTAACGTGKSTHTRLWRELFYERAVMVNDDKTFLQFTEDHVIAHGSPWSGKHGLDTNISVPLKGICILKRGNVNRIRSIPASEARDMLQHQSFAPEDVQAQAAVRMLVESLMQRIQLWEMECTKDPQAAAVAYQAMSGEK